MKILLIALLLSLSFAKSDKYSCPTEITKLTARLAGLYTNFQFGNIIASVSNIISIWEKIVEIQENCPVSEFNEFLYDKSNLLLNLIKVTYEASLIHFDDLKGHAHEQLSELQKKLKNILSTVPGIIGSIASKIPEYMTQVYSFTKEMAPIYVKQAYKYTKEKAPIVYDFVEEKISGLLSNILDLF